MHLLVLLPYRKGRHFVDSAVNNTSGINLNFGSGCGVWQALYGAMGGVLLTADVGRSEVYRKSCGTKCRSVADLHGSVRKL